MKNNVVLILCTVFGLLLSSCAVPSTFTEEKGLDFPFDKKFPGCEHPPSKFYYDLTYKWFTGSDGLMVGFDSTHFFNSPLKCTIEHKIYNEDLAGSEKEKLYHAAYRAMEEKFDRKYAGWIKKELLAASDWKINYWKDKKKYVVKKTAFDQTWLPKVKAGLLDYSSLYDAELKKKYEGSFSIDYPNYLETKELPEGLQTPSSFFSADFIAYYATTNEDGERFLFDHVRAYRLANGGHFYWDTNRLEQMTDSIIYDRFRVQYAEYVLTYYYLKKNDSMAEREQIGQDLAAFYREVSFRAAAEASYVYADSSYWLNNREKYAVATFVADRIHDFILIAFTNPTKFKEIRQNFKTKLEKICYENLSFKRSITFGTDCLFGQQWWDEISEKNVEIRKSIEENQEKCVND